MRDSLQVLGKMHLFIGVLASLVFPALVLSQSAKSCTTPKGERGTCISAKQCPFVTNLLTKYGKNVPREITNQIRELSCDGDKKAIFPICCPNTSALNARAEQPNLSYIDPKGMKVLDSVTDCGTRRTRHKRAQVSHGDRTRSDEFPWVVLLKYDTSGTRPFLCSGSLITDRFVLTAAHCITASAEIIAVRMGEHNLNTQKDCTTVHGEQSNCLPPYEEFGVEEIRSHPNFDRSSNSYDIALIKLNRSVAFKPHIRPICLPIDLTSQDLATDQSFYITGWGRTETRMPSPVLLKALITRQELDVCRKYYTSATLNENHICALGQGKQETCSGDSGGPLFSWHFFKETVRFVQYGVISFGGQSCGLNEDQPGVFASVLNMLPWITQNLY